MSKNTDAHITETELEILQTLWLEGKATVKDVHDALSVKRDARYTTTLKQMQVMHEKGLLTRDDTARQHIYFPAVEQKKVQKRFMDKMMQTFFKGSAGAFMLQALGQYKATDKELEEISQLIDSRKKAKK